MKLKKDNLKTKYVSKETLVNQSLKMLLNRQPKVLLYDIPRLNCDEKEKDRICLITLQENIIPNYSIKFEICGYTYNQLAEMHISIHEDLYSIQGQLYYTTYIGEGRFGETTELRKYFIEIEENTCYTKSRRLMGAKLIDLILQNYEPFFITEIFHNLDDLTKETIDFYEGLGFTRKCEFDNTNRSTFIKSFVQENPSSHFTKILDTPIEWL